jgi:arylformamidase
MKAIIEYNSDSYEIDFSNPIDISRPLNNGDENVNCFFAPQPEFTPLVSGSFIGSTAHGSPVNFYNVKLNPHGNGTHTECVGHISKEKFTINQCLKEFHFHAMLITINPIIVENGDSIINKKQIEEKVNLTGNIQALIVRTNKSGKNQIHSGTNPTFFQPEVFEYLNSIGITHFLTDLPSVDREEDGGELLSHKAFWEYPDKIQIHKTITELVYVEDNIKDGIYFLNIQIAAFELDVSPSKPLLYTMIRRY